jgi:hypothetical protein
MNTYYHSATSAEVEAIVRDGFIDQIKDKRSGMRGVYIADAPGEPDPDYPDDQLLEITLPAEIDCSQWELAAPENLEVARWRVWLIPARILNQHGRVRQLRKDQWKQLSAKYIDACILKTQEELVAVGFLERARDSQGQPIYRDGKAVWRLTEKARSISPENFEAEFQAALKAVPKKGN